MKKNGEEVSRRPTTLVICVNYHNDDETACFVQKLLAQEGEFDLQVVMVDNNEGCKGESVLVELARQERQVSLFQPGKNLGYFGGAAVGLEKYLATSPLPEWVIVSNTDISFQDSKVLGSLVCQYNADTLTAPAVVAPAIISAQNGADLNPFERRRPSRLRMHFLKWVFRFYTSFIIYGWLSYGKVWLKGKIKTTASISTDVAKHDTRPVTIYAPDGAFIIFNRRYFEAGGTLNYGAFLAGEEIFVAETARRLGLNVVYDPRLSIIHEVHFARLFCIPRGIARYMAEAAAYCADVFF